MGERLSRREKRRIYDQLCHRPEQPHACRDAREASRAAVALVGPPERMKLCSEYVLMRAIDRFCADELSVEELYRCRILAYVMRFGEGGEEWQQMGVAVGVQIGAPAGSPEDAPADLDGDDLPEL